MSRPGKCTATSSHDRRGDTFGQSVGEIHVAEAVGEVAFVKGANRQQVVAQAVAGRFRQHGHPVAAPLGPADGDVPEIEVDVLDAEPEALEDPHPGAVKQQHDELRHALETGKHGCHLFAAENIRQAARLAGTDHVVEPLEVGLEDVAVEKEDCRQGLTLGGDRDSVVLDEMVRKRLRSSPSRSRGWRRWNWM